MVKILQLLMHLTMLQIRFPSNVIYCLKYFKSIQTFQIIPVGQIYSFLKISISSQTDNLGINNRSLGGYEFLSLFMNLGMFLIISLGILLALMALKILKFFSKKSEL